MNIHLYFHTVEVKMSIKRLAKIKCWGSVDGHSFNPIYTTYVLFGYESYTVKPVLSGHSKIDKTEIYKTMVA